MNLILVAKTPSCVVNHNDHNVQWSSSVRRDEHSRVVIEKPSLHLHFSGNNGYAIREFSTLDSIAILPCTQIDLWGACVSFV